MGLRMRIAIASDHAAFDLKADLRDWLIEQGHEVADLGPDTADSVDYPDYGYKLAAVVADNLKFEPAAWAYWVFRGKVGDEGYH